MIHRHLNHQQHTLPAVDDVIERGRLRDWIELRDAARRDPAVAERIRRVCSARSTDSGAARHAFWLQYVRLHLA